MNMKFICGYCGITDYEPVTSKDGKTIKCIFCGKKQEFNGTLILEKSKEAKE